MLFNKLPIYIILLNRSDTCRRYVERLNLVIFDHPPAYPRVRCPSGFPLVHDSGPAPQQRPIYDKVVSDDPPDVRGGEHHIVSMYVEIVLEAVVVRGELPSVTAVDAFRRPGRPTRVKDKPGVVAWDGDHFMSLTLGDLGHLLVIVEVVAWVNVFFTEASTLDYYTLHLWLTCDLKGLVDVRDIRDDTVRFEAA